MSLWKPYIDDVPLDLSKPKGIECNYQPQITCEPVTPSSTSTSPGRSSSASTSVPQHDPVSPKCDTLCPFICTSGKRSSSLDSEGLSEDEDYQRFEQEAFRAMAEKNGGTLLSNNPRMRRSVRSTISDPDDAYIRQRDRNNVAAKQSRDKRKLGEIRLSLKVAYLRRQVAALKSAMASQRCLGCGQSCST